MFCTNCGKEVPDGQKFCMYCGADIEPAPEQSSVKVEGQFSSAASPGSVQSSSAGEQPQQPNQSGGTSDAQPFSNPYQASQPNQNQSPYTTQPVPDSGSYAAQPPSPEPPKKTPWYEKSWVIILFLLFFWPVGIPLMWRKNCTWSKGAKIAVSALVAVSVAFSAYQTFKKPSTTQPTPMPTVVKPSISATQSPTNTVSKTATYDWLEIVGYAYTPEELAEELGVTYDNTIAGGADDGVWICNNVGYHFSNRTQSGKTIVFETDLNGPDTVVSVGGVTVGMSETAAQNALEKSGYTWDKDKWNGASTLVFTGEDPDDGQTCLIIVSLESGASGNKVSRVEGIWGAHAKERYASM